MFHSFSKRKSGRDNTRQNAQKNEFKGLEDSKLSTKFEEANLHLKVLKEYPLEPLEVNTQSKRSADNLMIESLMVLQNQVYNQLMQMFFDAHDEDQASSKQHHVQTKLKIQN